MTTYPKLPDTAIELIAHRFKLLSEPSRLRLLCALQEGEKSMGELIALTRLTQANVSRQLHLLADGGLVRRSKRHLQVWYRLADPSLITSNQLVCERLELRGIQELDALPHGQVTTITATSTPLREAERGGSRQ